MPSGQELSVLYWSASHADAVLRELYEGFLASVSCQSIEYARDRDPREMVI